MASFAKMTLSAAQFHRWLARSRAWIALLILLPVGAICVFSPPASTIDSWADFGFETMGWIVFCAGIGLRWWATVYISGRKTDELICEGPYSICRNPIYWGTFLLTMAVAVLLQSFTFTVTALMVSAFYFFTTVLLEESNLEARHGEAFRDYCRRVPRVLPRWSAYHTETTVQLRLDGVRAEFLRTLRYAWLPIACHFVTHLRCQSWWPVLSHLP